MILRILPSWSKYAGMAIFPFVILKRGYRDRKIINHEKIHLHQQLELMVLLFYALYIGEFVVRLVWYRNWNKAYYNISFEREAHDKGDDLTYLVDRRPYAWVGYIWRGKQKDVS